MATEPISYGPAVAQDESAKYLARARALTGLTNGGWYFEPFAACSSDVPPGWTANNVGTGAMSRAINGKGGLFQLTSGGTAAGTGEAYTTNRVIGAALTDRWCVTIRFKVTTTPNGTDTRIFGGIHDTVTGDAIVAGVNCAGHATNFVVQYDGAYGGSTTVINSGLAFDTALHVVEFYCQGDSKLRTRWDRGAENASPPTMGTAAGNLAFILSARNVSQNASQTIQVDWFACLYPHA